MGLLKELVRAAQRSDGKGLLLWNWYMGLLKELVRAAQRSDGKGLLLWNWW
jgi:hypothetical protein